MILTLLHNTTVTLILCVCVSLLPFLQNNLFFVINMRGKVYATDTLICTCPSHVDGMYQHADMLCMYNNY